MQNTENNANIAKIEITGFQDLCRRYGQLEQENKQLKANNRIMADELTYFKEYAADLENAVNNLPKRYIHHIDETRIIPNINDLLEALIDLGGFTVSEVIGYNDEYEGYIIERVDDDFLNAELAAEAHENEIVSAMASYMED